VGASLLVSRVQFSSGSPEQDAAFGRVAIVSDLERPLGGDRLALRVSAGTVVGRRVPVQSLVYLGGPVSGPGYDFHEFVARSGGSAHIEWRHIALAIPLSLGRYGRLAMPVSLVPFAHAIWVDDRAADATETGGWYPSLGIGLLTVFDLLRFDVARGLRHGRWTFSVDFTRDLWRIL
jgi:hypothetical protein